MMLNNKHNVKDCYPASFSFFFICTVQKLFLPLQHQTTRDCNFPLNLKQTK